MRMRKKKWARPELEACPWAVLDSDACRGRWRALFPKDQPLHVELGCGKGVSTAEMAWSERNVNFVAVDISTDVLGVARRGIAARYGSEPVDNIRLAVKECSFISQAFSAEDRVERIYINFCNPWNQRDRQKKRRLTHPRQLMQYRDFLVDGGEIWFKTDDDSLFDDTVGYLQACGFRLRFLTRDLHASGFSPNYVSEHEAMFTAQGVKTKFLIAAKGPLAEKPDVLMRKKRPAPEMTTLCYIEQDGKYLLIHRNRRENDGNYGKWLGIGGHFERGESPEECVLREVREETGLALTEYASRGVVTFVMGDWVEYMYLFTASAFEGDLRPDCDEGDVQWVDKARLPELPMWPGDRIFLRLLDEGRPFFSLKLIYDDRGVAGAVLDGKPLDVGGGR